MADFKLTYKDYIISRSYDGFFQFSHDGFDGTPDSGDNRYGHGQTVRDCIDQIDFIYEEENWVENNPEEYARQLIAIQQSR